MPVPSPSAAKLAEARTLSARLFQVTERARADFAEIAAELDLTPQHARALLWLEQPAPMRSLADHLACDASNVTGIADRLERLRLVERQPGEDRRVKVLQLTRRGAALRAALAERVSHESTVTAKLTAPERRELAALLDKMLS